MPTTTLPPDFIAALGSESPDFSVKATRLQPLSKSIFLLAFGTFWTLFTSMFVIAFFGPVLMGKETHFTANGVATVAGPGNLGPLLAPGIFIGIFVLVGFGLLGSAIYSICAEGGYFVGTPTRLVNFRKGNFKSYDWEQFTWTVEMSGNAQKGNLSFEMRTGKMVSRKNGPDRYVPDTVYIAGIEDVFEVERFCRQRIRENDPTPANTATPPSV